MFIVAVPLLVAGVALVAASEGLLPAFSAAEGRRGTFQALGGSLTVLGLFAIGAGLPLFR